jgi:hypothetical protein
MTDVAHETATLTLEVVFTKIEEGWQLTDLSVEPVTSGTTLGAVAEILSILSDKYGDAMIRGGFYNPGTDQETG